MPKIEVLDMNGQKVDEMQLSDAVFGIDRSFIFLLSNVVLSVTIKLL